MEILQNNSFSSKIYFLIGRKTFYFENNDNATNSDVRYHIKRSCIGKPLMEWNSIEFLSEKKFALDVKISNWFHVKSPVTF